MGYQPLKITETGIAVYLDFHKGKTLAFRSDIDALEIEEQTGVSLKVHIKEKCMPVVMMDI